MQAEINESADYCRICQEERNVAEITFIMHNANKM